MRMTNWAPLRAPEDGGAGGPTGGGAASGSGAGAGEAGGGGAGTAGASGDKGGNDGKAKNGAADGAGAASGENQGAGQGAGKGTASGGAQNTGQDGARQQTAAGYRPENLPDHLYGKDDRETIDRLHKAVDGFRKSQSERGEMPADAKSYDFQASEAVKPYAEILGKDPFFAKVQEYAFEHGLTKKQYTGFMNAALGEMIAGQMVEPPFSPEKEIAALVPDVSDGKERAKQANRMIETAISRVKTWQEQGMPKPIATALLAGMDRATNVQLVDWIAAGRRETAPAMGGKPSSGTTPAELKARQADPRNQVGNDKYEKSFAEETDRLYKLAYPDTGGR